MPSTKTRLAPAALSLAFAASGVQAGGLNDDFESYPAGAFPASPWLDAASIGPAIPGYPAPPVPSATVVRTADAFGQPTQALAVSGVPSTPKGAYLTFGDQAVWSAQVDARVTRFANPDPNVVAPYMDAAANLGFFTNDPASSPWMALYASSVTHTWHFAYAGASVNSIFDYDYQLPVDLEHWYTLKLSYFFQVTTQVQTEIVDTATGTMLSGTNFGIGNVGVAQPDHWDSVLLWSLEGSTTTPATPGGATIGALSQFDNFGVSAVPEPAPAAMLAAGALLLAWRRRASARG